MTWQERRTVTILSTILAILCAALLIVLGIRYQENRDLPGEEAPAVPGAVTDPGAFTSLFYENGSTTLSFSLNEEGDWIWDADPDFPLDDAVITSITELLTSWKPQQTITDSATLESCGMDNPTATLTAGTAQGGAVTMLLGKATTDGSSYYMRYNGDESTAYIIDGGLYELLCVPIYDMCELPQLPQLTEDTIRSVTIQGAAPAEGERGVTTYLAAQRAEGEDSVTTWRSSGANVTDDETVRALLSDLETLAFEKCVDYRPSDEAATICGFDEPAAKLKVEYVTDTGVEQTLELTIGLPLPDGSGRYTRLGEDTTIYLLPTAALDPLMRVSVNGLEG
ncbi:MAG: DUF4340 domain-containing protein [Oscillospiraceae bacterium]|nr:DUF4340 domain-containing protein [Oscillospiraceae bacterium]